MENIMTTREFCTMFMEKFGSENAEMTAWVEHELTQLDKRKATRSSAQAKKRAEENAPIIEAILNLLSDGTAKTATEMSVPLELTFQKVGAICRKMVADGSLESEKRKVPKKGMQTFFFLVNKE